MIMQLAAWVAAILVFLAFFMKTMIPLRIVAIASNVAFIGYASLGIYYGIFEKVLPILVLHVALLPLNVLRLYQITHLVRRIREASLDEDALEYLVPYMRKEFLNSRNVWAPGRSSARSGSSRPTRNGPPPRSVARTPISTVSIATKSSSCTIRIPSSGSSSSVCFLVMLQKMSTARPAPDRLAPERKDPHGLAVRFSG